MDTPDLYQVLGVSREANLEELKSAYRRKSRELHPDRTGNDPAKTALFREVQQAYQTLSHDKTRAEYDRSIAPAESIMELFQRPHGRREMDFMLPAGRKEPRMGPHRFQTLMVSNDLLRNGGIIRFQTIELRIPTGTVAGAYLVLTGRGKPGANGGKPGDLYIRLTPKRGT